MTVTASGRLSLPADLSRRHGLAKGGEALIQETDDAIVLTTVDQALEDVRAIARAIAGDDGGVEACLTERPQDAERERRDSSSARRP